jgi:5'-nucleotidase
VGASPSQCVIIAMTEILPHPPDLIVSGINYGANTGVDITRSGTIGAALEGANYGIPALAVSLETEADNTFLHTFEEDFSTAGYFTALFANVILKTQFQKDVQVLKVEVPVGATRETPWEITRLAPMTLYLPVIKERNSWQEKIQFQWRFQPDFSVFPKAPIRILFL